MRNHTRSGAKGIVLSDLHLFARRSEGIKCVSSVHSQLAAVDVLVLNGDIFDFRWSTVPGVDATSVAAVDWLTRLLETFPQCRIHYIVGNHDCLRLFRERLIALAATQPRLCCHEHGVRLGNALFLHGDCAQRKMDPDGLSRYRQCWDNDRQHGSLRTQAYLTVDRLGITRFTHKHWFPRRQTVERVVHYLDCANPGWQQGVQNCYFGHTHLPFAGHHHNGVNFHNTGSAIRGMGFNPIAFSVDFERTESLRGPGGDS